MRRGIKEGITFGIIAGIIFAVAEMLATRLLGEVGLMPLRMFASVVLGGSAMTTTQLVPTVAIGLVVHFVLAAIFGAIYGLIEARVPEEPRFSFSRQALYGMVFGIVLWFVNFQIIARIFYPWFLAPPQGVQMMLHAIFFGLPIGLMFAAFERGGLRVPPTPRPI